MGAASALGAAIDGKAYKAMHKYGGFNVELGARFDVKRTSYK